MAHIHTGRAVLLVVGALAMIAVLLVGTGCARSADTGPIDISQGSSAAGDADDVANTDDGAGDSASAEDPSASGSGDVDQAELAEIEAELAAIEAELGSLAMPSDSDFGSVESALY